MDLWMDGWMDGWIAIVHPFQQFSAIMGRLGEGKRWRGGRGEDGDNERLRAIEPRLRFKIFQRFQDENYISSMLLSHSKMYKLHVVVYIQSTLVISKSKGPTKTLRDIRTSTYQNCSIEEKQFEQPNFTNDYVI